MSKKTISVEKIVREGNTLLSSSLNTPEERDHPTMQGMRRGVMRLMEFVLLETGNSLGFDYLSAEDDGQIFDDTLRRYHLPVGKPHKFGKVEPEPETAEEEESVKERLEYLRGEIQAERISMGEILELQGLVDHIDPGDVLLLEWAGVPEFAPEEEISPRFRLKVEIELGNQGVERVTIPAGTEVVIEARNGDTWDASTVSNDDPSWVQQDFWVRPSEIEEIPPA